VAGCYHGWNAACGLGKVVAHLLCVGWKRIMTIVPCSALKGLCSTNEIFCRHFLKSVRLKATNFTVFMGEMSLAAG
jgi:hypothetical protein